MKAERISCSPSISGRPPRIASMFAGKLDCAGVWRQSWFRTTSAVASRFSSITTRTPSRFDSSRMSATPSIRLSRAASASPCIISVNRPASSSASATGFPVTSCVIIEIDACDIEQPSPTNLASSITPSRTRIWRCTSSPQVGFFMWTATSGSGSSPLLRGRL